MRKIVMTCILFASLFFGLSFGFRSNAYTLADNGNLISDNVFNKDDTGLVYATGYAPGSSQSDWVRVGNIRLIANTTYTASKTMSRVYYRFGGTGDYQLLVSDVSTFTTPASATFISVTFSKYIGAGQTVETSRQYWNDLMLNFGTTSLPYEPFGIWYSTEFMDSAQNNAYENGYDVGYNDGKAYYSQPQYIYGNLYNATWSFDWELSTGNYTDIIPMGFIPDNAYYTNGISIDVLYHLADDKRYNDMITNIARGGRYRIYFNVYGESGNHTYSIIDYRLYNYLVEYTFAVYDNSNLVYGQIVPTSLFPLPVLSSSSFSFNGTYNSIMISLFDNPDNGNVYGYISNNTGLDASIRESLVQQGYNDGYHSGFSLGNEQGLSEGYNKGYNKGYNEGYNSGAGGNNTLVGMIYAVIDAPFQVLKDSLNFNFLGVNIADFILSFITLIICIRILRFFL